MGVGQLLGKLFGGDPGKGELPLRAYGKLPFYAEYRRLDVSPGAPTQFSQWLDNGRLSWKRSPSHKDHSVTRHMHLMLRLPEAKELVVASLWDSRDSLGRVFPFTFFVVCPPEALGNTLLERWVAAQRLHNTFDSFHTEFATLGRGGDFYKLFQKRTLLPRPDDLEARTERLRSESRRVASSDYFDQGVKSEGVASESWFGGLAYRTERWRANPSVVAELALSIPLARGLSREAQVGAWLDWLDGWLGRNGRSASVLAPAGSMLTGPPQAVSPAAPAKPAPQVLPDTKSPDLMCVVARDLMPDDFQVMTSDAGAFDFVTRLGALPSVEGGAAVPPVAAQGALADWLRDAAGPARA